MRVVLDTNVIVSASLTPEGPSATIVELVLAGTFTLCLFEDVLQEYRDVLARPKFSRQSERIAVLLDGIAEIAVRASQGGRLSVCSDKKDNRLLECAAASDAEYLVTGNLRDFPRTFGGTQVLSPREFLDTAGF